MYCLSDRSPLTIARSWLVSRRSLRSAGIARVRKQVPIIGSCQKTFKRSPSDFGLIGKSDLSCRLRWRVCARACSKCGCKCAHDPRHFGRLCASIRPRRQLPPAPAACWPLRNREPPLPNACPMLRVRLFCYAPSSRDALRHSKTCEFSSCTGRWADNRANAFFPRWGTWSGAEFHCSVRRRFIEDSSKASI